jgi:hypothetical protein
MAPWSLLVSLAARSAPAVHIIRWKDDPYSMDLAQEFFNEIRNHRRVEILPYGDIDYSTGSFHQPNRSEQKVIERMLVPPGTQPSLTEQVDQRFALVLPADDRCLRRFLRALVNAAPMAMRNAVVMTGDYLGLDAFYRDRAWAWNVQEFPVPLVFFSHQNPMEARVWEVLEPGKTARDGAYFSNTGTVLLNTFLMENLIQAAVPPSGAGEPRPMCVSARELAQRLRTTAHFDDHGNRREASGEYVVVFLPQFGSDQVPRSALLEVRSWQSLPGTQGPRRAWKKEESLKVSYGNPDDSRTGHQP